MPDLIFEKTQPNTNIPLIKQNNEDRGIEESFIEVEDKDFNQGKHEKERGNESGYYTDFNNTSLEHQQDFEIDSTNDNYSESSVGNATYLEFLVGINSKLDNYQKFDRCISSEVEADSTNSVTGSDTFNSEDSYDSQSGPLCFNYKDKNNKVKNIEDEYYVEVEKIAKSCAESVLQSDDEQMTYSRSSSCSNKSTTTSSSCSLNDEDEDQCRIDSYPGYGSRYGQLRYDHENTIEGIVRKEDSFSLAKVELSAKEREKYEDIWQKIDKVHDDLKRDCDKDEDYYEKCEKELDEIIDQALKQRIMFTFPYKGEVSFVDRIIDTLKKLRISYTDDQIYEFMDKTKILKIMSEGAYLNESTRENHEDYVNKICAERKTLKKEMISSQSFFKNIAYKSIVSGNKQGQNYDFKVEVDNSYFYIKYEESSVIEFSRIANSKTIKGLDFKIGILQIGSSVIRVERLEEKRNYTDVPEGKIKMSFTVKIEDKTEKISIFLYSDKEDSSKVRVELDGESQEKFDKLKDKSNLGKNCLLGGKSVLKAIQDKEFTKHGPYEPPATFVERISTSNVSNNLQR